MPFDIFKSNDESTDSGNDTDAEIEPDGGSDEEPAAEVEIDDDRVPEVDSEERYTASWESQNGAIEAEATSNHPVTAMLFLGGGLLLYLLGTAVVVAVAGLALVGIAAVIGSLLSKGWDEIPVGSDDDPDAADDMSEPEDPIEIGIDDDGLDDEDLSDDESDTEAAD